MERAANKRGDMELGKTVYSTRNEVPRGHSVRKQVKGTNLWHVTFFFFFGRDPHLILLDHLKVLFFFLFSFVVLLFF